MATESACRHRSADADRCRISIHHFRRRRASSTKANPVVSSDAGSGTTLMFISNGSPAMNMKPLIRSSPSVAGVAASAPALFRLKLNAPGVRAVVE